MGTVEHAFMTEAEAIAFKYGVEYVNDDSAEVRGIDERTIQGQKVFVVVVDDADSETDLWPDDKLPR
jgi:hypothetical protein